MNCPGMILEIRKIRDSIAVDVSGCPRAAAALNGTPTSRGRDFTHTDGAGLKSPKASRAVTTNPARAADAAAARVETPARRSRIGARNGCF